MSTLKEHIEDSILVKVCWDSFNDLGYWYPNLDIEMSLDEQFKQNVENGYISVGGRKL